MHPLTKATQLTGRASTTDLDNGALADLYAYPPAPAGGVVLRANMVGSIDGAATVDGLSGGLGGDGDHRVFMVLRGLADVVLVGARTAIAEGYGPVRPNSDLAGHRAALGQSPTASLALVSSSLNIPAGNPLITDAGTEILTCRNSPAEARARLLDAGATLVDCGTDSVDLAMVGVHLAGSGRSRVLCEGGPSLLGTLLEHDLLDELCVTVAPMLTAGDAKHLTAGASTARRMRRAHILADDEDYLYVRWVRDQR
ncbi:dihydrofolate reductase family protein [Nocardia sp. 348MFTsu5.1]|uniref:dihydrofolate reductase family protein n=1 Tax=Nocardia sp. 348MFTsu5.1 TaxID=1172185 RepID=UPI0003798502|nr:dihydrofolate reductase family protein [Nocardia sp. 348MFTsu5.1]